MALRKHNLKLSPAKAKLGATDADFLGYTISSCVSPNADNIAALTKMPMPNNTKQTRSLLGGIGYYRKFLKSLSTPLHPINALLKQGVKLVSFQKWRSSSGTTSTNTPPLRSWSTLTGTPSPTTPALSASTATPASTSLAPPSSKNNRTALSALSSSSAAPPSTKTRLNTPRPRSR